MPYCMAEIIHGCNLWGYLTNRLRWSPFQGGDTGSNPVTPTRLRIMYSEMNQIVLWHIGTTKIHKLPVLVNDSKVQRGTGRKS